MTRIIIVCAGSQGAIVADILQRAHESGGTLTPLGFVDDTPSLLGTTVMTLPVLGPIASLRQIEHDAIVVAVGDNRSRRMMTESLLASGERLATAIHPRAYVAPTARLGEGTMVSAGALVLPRVVVGRGSLLNTKASVDHDSIVGDFGHVSAGATVGAHVEIGAEVLVALGASVASGKRVGERSVVGAGAVVIRDLPADVVAWGVPARITAHRT